MSFPLFYLSSSKESNISLKKVFFFCFLLVVVKFFNAQVVIFGQNSNNGWSCTINRTSRNAIKFWKKFVNSKIFNWLFSKRVSWATFYFYKSVTCTENNVLKSSKTCDCGLCPKIVVLPLPWKKVSKLMVRLYYYPQSI